MIYSVTDIEKFKSQIKPELLNNPQFMREWESAYSYLSRVSGSGSFNLIISEDGKSISIQEQYVSKEKNEKIKNNSELLKINLALDEDDDFVIDTSMGTSMEIKGYIDAICQKGDGSIDYDLRKKMTDELSKYSSILFTSYSKTIYDKEGIEMHRGHFSDTYPLTNLNVGESLDGQVLTELHKPPKWTFGGGPEMPRYISNASYGYTYRLYENLGLAYSVVAKGISSNTSVSNPSREVRSYQSTVGTEYPEHLAYVDDRFAVMILNPDKSSQERMIGCGEFEGLSEYEISKRVALVFEKGIQTSKTKLFDPEIFSVLESRVRLANARFNLTETPDQQQDVSEQPYTR